MAQGTRHREAGDRRRLASPGRPPVLDLAESPTHRATAGLRRGPRSDSDDVARESAVGRATHSRRTPEAGPAGVSDDGGEVHAALDQDNHSDMPAVVRAGDPRPRAAAHCPCGRDVIDRTFQAVHTTAKAMGIEDVVTAAHSPWQNGCVERFIGSVRRQCLDHIIVLIENGLRRTLESYVTYYTGSRTHLSLAKDSPQPRPTCVRPTAGSLPSRRLADSINVARHRPDDGLAAAATIISMAVGTGEQRWSSPPSVDRSPPPPSATPTTRASRWRRCAIRSS